MKKQHVCTKGTILRQQPQFKNCLSLRKARPDPDLYLPLLHLVLTMWVLPLVWKVLFKSPDSLTLQTRALKNLSHHMPFSTTANISSYFAGPLKFALFNVGSLTNKTFIINDLITSHKLDCIVFTDLIRQVARN